MLTSADVKNNLSRWVSCYFRAWTARRIHPEVYHSDTTLKKTHSTTLLFPPLCFIITPVCFTQSRWKELGSYLFLKSGVDSDLPADHQACNGSYQPVLVAPGWTALYLLSVVQDVEQHRHWADGKQDISSTACKLAYCRKHIRLLTDQHVTVCVLFVGKKGLVRCAKRGVCERCFQLFLIKDMQLELFGTESTMIIHHKVFTLQFSSYSMLLIQISQYINSTNNVPKKQNQHLLDTFSAIVQ